MTKKRVLWHGETIRLRMSLASFRHGEHSVTIPIVRDYLMQASPAEVCAKLLIPALRALKRAQGIRSPRKRTAK